MDENKIDPVVEQPSQIVDPGYTNEQLHNESIRDIAGNTQEPTPPAPEPTPEPVKETPAIDEEAAKRIADEAVSQALAKQEEERAHVEAEAKAAEAARTPQEDAYAQWEKALWEKEKRQPTYVEALNFVKDQAKSEIKSEQEQAVKAAEDERVRREQETAANNKQLDAIIDDELGDLYNAGKLTRVKDATNPSDQGVVERQALFKKWSEVNTERRSKGLPDILSATRIYEFYFQKPSAQPPGADAPVQGNRGSATPPSSQQEYSYQDLKKPWSFFKRG